MDLIDRVVDLGLAAAGGHLPVRAGCDGGLRDERAGSALRQEIGAAAVANVGVTGRAVVEAEQRLVAVQLHEGGLELPIVARAQPGGDVGFGVVA